MSATMTTVIESVSLVDDRSAAETSPQDGVSIVVPIYNEQDNVARLVDAVHDGLRGFTMPWELVLVDDGSSDESLRRAHASAAEHGAHVRVVALRRNFGQTAAMQAGIDHARGALIVTMDGDLQNDPADIPRMVEQLIERDLDLLAGWRQQRQDKFLLRRLPSWIANRLIGRVTGVRLHDYGCSLKVYRADVIREVKLFGEMHRFIPAWVAAVTPPSRIGETVVNHKARTHGESKYGISRTIRVLLDLLAVMFFMRYTARPGHFFGSIGLLVGAIGSVILLYLGVDKFVLGHNIGTRPLLLIGVVLMIASLQFLTTGILAELQARIYYGSSEHKSYIIAERETSPAPSVEQGWHRPAGDAGTPAVK